VKSLLETNDDAGLRFLKQRLLCLEMNGFLKSKQEAEAAVVLLATPMALVAAMIGLRRKKKSERESLRMISESSPSDTDKHVSF
jgi:hypothetical protein